jgi:hypothetical protein
MSETQQAPNTGADPSPAVVEPARHPSNDRAEGTGWVGWVIFAGVMMVVVGGFQVTMASSPCSTINTSSSRATGSWSPPTTRRGDGSIWRWA